MPYEPNGTLVSDKLQIADSDGWDTQAEWEAYQSRSSVEIINGVVQLADTSAPSSGDLQAHYVAGQQPESDGQTVSPFVDQQGTDDLAATGDPLLQTGVIDAEDVVRYDGADDYHDASGTTISQPLHVFAVAQFHNTTSTQKIFDGGDSTNRCLLHYNNNAWQIWAGNTFVGGGTPDTSPHLFSAYFDGANSYFEVDGTQIGSADPGANGLTLFTLGGRLGGSEPLDGDIAEVAVHGSAISSTAESDWETYLADKYGITLS